MSNLKDALHIPDTLSARDERHLAIQRVGVRGVRYPMQLEDSWCHRFRMVCIMAGAP